MLKCIKCGACCINNEDRKWIEVSQDDARSIDSSLLQPGDIQPFAMRQTEDGRCVALAGNIREACACLIYANRPAVCKEVVPGSVICCRCRGLQNLK